MLLAHLTVSQSFFLLLLRFKVKRVVSQTIQTSPRSLICTAYQNKFASSAEIQPKNKITTMVSWSYQCSKVLTATLSQKATVVTSALACGGCHILWCEKMLQNHNKTRPRFTKLKLHHRTRTTKYKTPVRKPRTETLFDPENQSRKETYSTRKPGPS